MNHWNELRDAVKDDLPILREGPDWIAVRWPGSGLVIRIRLRLANGVAFVQALVPVVAATSISPFAMLRLTAERVFGALAVDEETLVLRDNLPLRAGAWPNVKQLITLLTRDAEKLALSVRSARGEHTYALAFAD